MRPLTFEQGPIRPPSEAYSLLLRVTRNCPWNRCGFCHTYKGQRFQARDVEEVKQDIEAIRQIAEEIKALSWRQGQGGEVTPSLVRSFFCDPDRSRDGFRSVSLWLLNGGKNVFLQDADSLCIQTDRVVEILKYLKETFPSIERVTTYARAKTISQKTVEELKALFDAGLRRIHIGLETGYDPLLEYVRKGVTAEEHGEAGRKVKASGISLSEYVILGLGGRAMWQEHATHTAKVLNAIDPDFIRVRTLKLLPGMPLYEKLEQGQFHLLTDDEVVREERLLIEGLEGIQSTFVSDHILNLLEEVEGKLPQDKDRMLGVIDRYFSLPERVRENYRLGRRAGIYRVLDDLSDPERYGQVEEALTRVKALNPGGLEEALSDLTASFI